MITVESLGEGRKAKLKKHRAVVPHWGSLCLVSLTRSFGGPGIVCGCLRAGVCSLGGLSSTYRGCLVHFQVKHV